MTDTVAGAASNAAGSDAVGKAVPAVAGKALPEPFVPGSGDRIPAELRLVLAGYVGIACGWFAGALASAAAAVFTFFNYVDDGDAAGLLFGLAYLVVGVCIAGLWEALVAGIRFSRLLRRPSDARTATVMASKRGGRTLILDIIPRDGTPGGYRPLSEVRLALRTKAGILVPGETVKVYIGPGASGESPLLVSSAQRGRAFLGTLTSWSTVQPGPVGPLDEKVSRATLVDWAAWAASTTFSSTGLRIGYHRAEVDAFRSAVRDTFRGISKPPVRSDDLDGKQFSSHRPGYDKTQVEAFLDAAGIRLAAMESTDRPTGPLVSDAAHVAWAEWADSTTFSKPSWSRRGYDGIEVDAFLGAIRNTFLGVSVPPVRSDGLRSKQFSTHLRGWLLGWPWCYDKKQVAGFLDAAGIRLAAVELTGRPAGPLVNRAILAEWAEWADSTRFSTTARLSTGYDIAEVDAFQEQLGDTFLGVRDPPVMPDSARGKRFSTHRPGYDTLQVDAFLDTAAWRLAAIKSEGQALCQGGKEPDRWEA